MTQASRVQLLGAPVANILHLVIAGIARVIVIATDSVGLLALMSRGPPRLQFAFLLRNFLQPLDRIRLECDTERHATDIAQPCLD
jgi:hypothetical protein